MLDDIAVFSSSGTAQVSSSSSSFEGSASSPVETNAVCLHIGTTNTRDASERYFSFDVGCRVDENSVDQRERLLTAVRASATIPPSFHPWDVISRSRRLSYPKHEGIEIDGEYFVDGGITAPAPRVPNNNSDRNDTIEVVISPLIGTNQRLSRRLRISPSSGSSFWTPNIYLPHDFGVALSLQNLRAFRASLGVTSRRELELWYEAGERDAVLFLEQQKWQ